MTSFSRRLTGPFFLFFFLTSAFARVALADLLTAKIVSIADGDTVTAVLSGGRSVDVRLEGIDAPNTGRPLSLRPKSI